MVQALNDDRDKVKEIIFPLPDLRGPGGNAFVLLGEAARLMKEKGISDSVQSQFHTVATSGNYEHLLDTLQDWFTVAVSVTQYVPLPSDKRLSTLAPKGTDDPEREECIGCGRADGSHANGCTEVPEAQWDIKPKWQAEIEKGIEDGTIPVIDLRGKQNVEATDER